MFRYLLIMCWLLVISAACSPTNAEPAASQSAETDVSVAEESEGVADHEDEHEGDHEDDHESDHEDDHDDDHDDEHREHGAHEHGTAAMTIAWSGDELAIDLDTPAFNVLGFEYAPGTDEEQNLFNESVATLEAGQLLQLSPEAACTVISADVHSELAEDEHEDEHEDEGGQEETHSDIDVSYLVQCQNPDQLQSLDAGELFAQFPNFEALQVQWVSDTNQSADELTAEDPILSFE